MPTLQQLFDTGVKGVIDQGQLSLTHGLLGPVAGHYRHTDDNAVRCVIGHLIPDAAYSPAMDTGFYTGVDALTRRYPDSLAHLRPHAMALNELQACHDKARGIADFKSRCRKFASTHNLTVPEYLQ